MKLGLWNLISLEASSVKFYNSLINKPSLTKLLFIPVGNYSVWNPKFNLSPPKAVIWLLIKSFLINETGLN